MIKRFRKWRDRIRPNDAVAVFDKEDNLITSGTIKAFTPDNIILTNSIVTVLNAKEVRMEKLN